MIRFEQVGLDYDDRRALHDLSFTLPSGAFTFLTGHSGAGKSSLLRLLAHLERPTRGRIRVGDIDYTRLRPRDATRLRQQMGIVFQDNRLLFDRDVFDNVALPLVIAGYRLRDIRTRTLAALDRVGLAERAESDPATLSGGEQQRVGIARAVVARPRLLLADEPTGNLDEAVSADIMRLLSRFNEAGVAVVFATHDRLLLERHPYRRVVLVGGRLAADEQDPADRPGATAMPRA